MKKHFNTSGNDWKVYDKSDYSLMKQNISPKRKKRKTSRARKYSENLINSKSNNEYGPSQDGSINWSSSDEEVSKTSDLQHSPIIYGSSCKQFISLGGNYVKSTPAGSPILTQKTTNEKRSKPRRFSLLPISPISSGLPSDTSFPNISSFSIHAQEESDIKDTTLDHTPLAVPLPDSEDETAVGSFEQTTFPSDGLTDDDIEVVTTQTDGTPCGDEAPDKWGDISTLEDTLESSLTPTQPVCDKIIVAAESSTSNLRGSSWIEDMMGKLDDSSKPRDSSSATVSVAELYDSAKKRKFAKNGMAEQLNRVLRQEQTQKVLFKHQLKGINSLDNNAYQRSIKLKVVSHHRDGMLHILESKVLSKGKKCEQKSSFLTLMLNHRDVVENEIDLMSIFSIFPPWKELHLPQHNFPVLICVYHIKMESCTDKSTSTSQTESLLNNDVHVVAEESADPIERKQDCENLLEALERQESASGICLAATVQRIYQNPSNESSWNWLCEDAYGFFFELSLEASLASEKSWSRLIKHGEGQRLYFEKLFLTGRSTRKHVGSVYKSDIIDAKRPSSEDANSSQIFQPPSFCYKLAAARWQSKCYFSTTEETMVCSPKITSNDLNRPNLSCSTTCDVLYRSPQLFDCRQLTMEDKFLKQFRISLLGKVLHKHIPNLHTSIESQAISCLSDHEVFIFDATSLNSKDIVVISSGKSLDQLDLGDLVLFKDIRFTSDRKFIADSYTRIATLESLNNNSSEKLPSLDSNTELQRFPEANISFLNHCRRAKMENFAKLVISDDPGTFALVEGVICHVLSAADNDHMVSTQQGTSSRDKNFLRVLASHESANASSALGDTIEILVMMTLAFKVRLKILQETAWKLVSEVEIHEEVNSSTLNGKKVSPLPCLVYAKSTTSLQTTFYAEEIHIT